MNKLLVTCVAVLVVAGAVLLSPWQPSSTTVDVGATATQTSSAPLAAASAASQPAPREAPASGARRRPAGEIAAATGDPTTLLVRVRWGDDRTPAAGVGVEVTPGPSDDDTDLRTLRGTTGAGGEVRFGAVAAGKVVVSSDSGGAASVDIASGRAHEVDLEIPSGLTVDGTVVDRNGLPAAGARIWLARASLCASYGREVAISDAAGRFHLRCVQPERTLSARKDGCVAARLCVLPAASPGPVVVRLELGGRGCALSGVVRLPDGRGAAGALVLAGQSFDGEFCRAEDLARTTPELRLEADAHGEFAAGTLRPGPRVALWARAPGTATWKGEAQIWPDREARVEIQLATGATVRGRIADRSGSPLAKVAVRALQDGIDLAPGELFMGPLWARRLTATDAAGRFTLAGIKPGKVVLSTGSGEFGRAEVSLELGDGEERTWDPVLDPLRAIEGTVQDELGAPLAGWSVWTRSGSRAESAHVRTDPAGSFRIERCAEPRYAVCVKDPDSVLRDVTWSVPGVEPGKERLSIVVPAARRSTSFFTGTLLDVEGAPLRSETLQVFALLLREDAGPDPAHATIATGDGRFRLGPLAAGRYEVGALVLPWESLSLGTWVVAAGETRDVGTHRFAEPGFVRLRVRNAEGAPLDAGSFEVIAVDRAILREVVVILKGDGRSRPSEPGRYRVQPLSGRFLGIAPLCAREVEVRAGEETLVEIDLPRGVFRKVRCPPVGGGDVRLTVIWRDGAGAIVAEDSRPWSNESAPITFEQCFVPGTYAVEVADARGQKATARLTVDTRETSDEVFELPLPGALSARK